MAPEFPGVARVRARYRVHTAAPGLRRGRRERRCRREARGTARGLPHNFRDAQGGVRVHG